MAEIFINHGEFNLDAQASDRAARPVQTAPILAEIVVVFDLKGGD